MKIRDLGVIVLILTGVACSSGNNPLLGMTPEQADTVFDYSVENKLDQCQKIELLTREEKEKMPDVFIGNLMFECSAFYNELLARLSENSINNVEKEHFSEKFYSYKGSVLDPAVKKIRAARITEENARKAKEQAEKMKLAEKQRRVNSLESEIRRLEEQHKFQTQQESNNKVELASLINQTVGGKNPHLKDRIPYYQQQVEKWSQAKTATLKEREQKEKALVEITNS